MLEEYKTLLTNGDTGINTGFWRSVRNYIRQPKIVDWIIVGIIVICVVSTIILCVWNRKKQKKNKKKTKKNQKKIKKKSITYNKQDYITYIYLLVIQIYKK